MLKHIKFIDNHGSFCVNRPENTSYLYFPLASEAGLKSSVTPVLGGDSKIDQDTFLLEPSVPKIFITIVLPEISGS